MGGAVRSAARPVRARLLRAVRRAVGDHEQVRERRDGLHGGSVARRRDLPRRHAHPRQPRAGAAPVDRDQPGAPAEPGRDRGAVPSRLPHRLHRRGSPARPGAAPDPRVRHAGADDRQRAPRDLRADAPRRRHGPTGGARLRHALRRVDDAGDLGRRDRPDRSTGRVLPGRLHRGDLRARQHRALARRPGAGLPRPQQRRRHDRARPRRPQLHVQERGPQPDPAHREERLRGGRSTATASTPGSWPATWPPSTTATPTPARTWAGA